MNPRALAVLVTILCAASLNADSTLNFWNKTVWKAAQVYPLDKTVYTGWGPDWQDAGLFHDMTIAFDAKGVGFVLDTQFNGATDLKLHVNAVYGFVTLVPEVFKVHLGKLKLDDYRLATDVIDKGQGRIQIPDEWLAAAATVSGAGFRSTLVLPSYAGSTASPHINATASGPNKPGQMKAEDLLTYFDWVASYDAGRIGLKLLAGTFGDTTGGLAYGSTGTDLPGFGTKDPKQVIRTYYAGLVYTGIKGLSAQAAGTYWGSPSTASVQDTNLRLTAGLKGTLGSWQLGVEALGDYRSAVKSETKSAVQAVNGVTSSSYSIQAGPITYLGLVSASTSLKSLTTVDASFGLAVGYGNQDLYQGNGLGSYSLPTFDQFIEIQPSLTYQPANLKVALDYKYDLSAGVATWVVPVTLTLSSL